MTVEEYPGEFAKDDEDANERHKKWINKDPFPEVDPALLNFADIYDYVRVTGMVLTL